jgi:hypothetical protein
MHLPIAAQGIRDSAERLNGPLRGIRTMVAPVPVDNLRCRVLRYDAGPISIGFKNHAAIGNSGNEVPRHPDAAGLKRQRRREHVAAPRVDFHWWQGILEMGRKSVFLHARVPKSARTGARASGTKRGKATVDNYSTVKSAQRLSATLSIRPSGRVQIIDM